MIDSGTALIIQAAAATVLGASALLWNIVRQRKALVQKTESAEQKAGTVIFGQALQMIESYKSDLKMRSEEIVRLGSEIEKLRARVKRLENRNGVLLNALARELKQPVTLVELQLGNAEDDPNPAP